jgi:hypothetical protein
VVALPTFAPHAALDQAADLGVTADWPILGVIGIRRRSWLASLFTRRATAPDAPRPDPRVAETQEPETAPGDIHVEGEKDE